MFSSFNEVEDDTLTLSPMLVGWVEEFAFESSTVITLDAESADDARVNSLGADGRGLALILSILSRRGENMATMMVESRLRDVVYGRERRAGRKGRVGCAGKRRSHSLVS